MDAEPEARQLAEIDVALPDLARVALDEQAEFVGPAGPEIEVEGHEECSLLGTHI